ncbi:protocatechuate 3,4-dioxygenase subunit alpha [Corynebacterium poyangense]|uniref:Protocatechuate 3,4-dioxygenase subunit alpha n=1 Tax=Corynebacterium poyangense TaxID=2684405 RepID=A0A7H0SQJ4_9CORY|nr:protocatechuate 3,4-dioxygenase subunit alpha [Corynebacterium poyangense]MBZ8178290.1 protocatechuate 3,4-dioxygenase subunit alpha [Corynebacterium poyangense]QNQ90819.1 protocatechuate 3,4-dioxygenase subunit alpha [Corynebacterium poyangense]
MIDNMKTGEFRYHQSAITDQDEAEWGITPSQTVGPYVHIGLTREGSEIMVDPTDPNAIEVTISVTDGAGEPIADAMIEIWQTNCAGIYNSPLDPDCDQASPEGFRGLGRGMVNDAGEVTFTTLKPGSRGQEAAHFKVGVFARGMLERLYTRMYLADESATDPVLEIVPEERRHLLIAQEVPGGYRFDIQVQHEDPTKETPFFDTH